jgi:hypothetical protein
MSKELEFKRRKDFLIPDGTWPPGMTPEILDAEIERMIASGDCESVMINGEEYIHLSKKLRDMDADELNEYFWKEVQRPDH